MKFTHFITALFSVATFYLLLTSFQGNDHSKRSLQSSGDISLPKNFVNINNLFILYFEFNPDDTMTMAIQFNIPGQYFSIGFGTNMMGSDIWTFELINSEIVAKDCLGVGYAPPAEDTNQGGTNDLETLGYEITPEHSIVKIKRAMNTGDPNDVVLQQGMIDLIYATGESPTMSYHKRSGRGVTVIPLIQGTEASVEVSSGADAEIIEEAHSLGNLIAWGLVVDIGILLVRFFRGTQIKIKKLTISVQLIHGLLMTALVVVSAVVTGLLLKQNRKERGTRLSQMPDRDFHFINGLIILFLIILTIVPGLISYLRLRSYKIQPSPRFTLKTFHRIFGIAVYLIAKANIITGVLFYNEGSWKTPVLAYLGALLLVHIKLQFYYSYQVHISNKPPAETYKPSKLPIHLALLEAINKGTPRAEIIAKFPTLKWLMLGNRVYDLTGWIHPGGNAIIEVCVGREVGRFFYGNYALENTKMQPHKHTALTVTQMQSFCIGELTNAESLLISKNSNKEAKKWKVTEKAVVPSTLLEATSPETALSLKNTDKEGAFLNKWKNSKPSIPSTFQEIGSPENILISKGNDNEAVSLPSDKWKIAGKVSISPTVSEIQFQSPDFQVRNYGKSLTWLGRHYRLSQDTNSSRARAYTTAFSLSQSNFDLRQGMYKYFDEIMSGKKEPVFTYDSSYLLPQDSLPLYLKDYDTFTSSFSHFVHTVKLDDPVNNKFRVEGPFGRGLELTPTSTGTHCIICAGTGVLPFIDFLSLFLWKTMYELIKEKAGLDQAEQINILDIPFNTFFNGMDIIFIGAFANENEVLGLDILKKLAEISSKYKVNNFTGIIKGYSHPDLIQVKASFSTEFLSKYIRDTQEQFYIVGPPKMNDSVSKTLQELGIGQEKIMLV